VLSGLLCRRRLGSGTSPAVCLACAVEGCLPPCLSVSQSPCLSLHVPLRPMVSLSVCLSLGPHPPVCVAVSPSLAFWDYLCGEGQRLTRRLAWVRHAWVRHALCITWQQKTMEYLEQIEPGSTPSTVRDVGAPALGGQASARVRARARVQARARARASTSAWRARAREREEIDAEREREIRKTA
jgi:hypothetical protein